MTNSTVTVKLPLDIKRFLPVCQLFRNYIATRRDRQFHLHFQSRVRVARANAAFVQLDRAARDREAQADAAARCGRGRSPRGKTRRTGAAAPLPARPVRGRARRPRPSRCCRASVTSTAVAGGA